MIRLIRNDGVEILLNVDHIKTITYDLKTTIILSNDDHLLVKNSENDIIQKIAAYRSGINDDKETARKK